MGEVKLTQGKIALVDDADFEYLNQWKWFYHNGYAERSINLGTDKDGRQNIQTIKMHRVIMGVTDPTILVDHRNDNGEIDGLNNRRSNLRLATHGQNMSNTKAYKGRQYKGVYPQGKKYYAAIRVDKVLKYLGSFSSQLKAARAYDVAAAQYFGQFARLNNV